MNRIKYRSVFQPDRSYCARRTPTIRAGSGQARPVPDRVHRLLAPATDRFPVLDFRT